MQEWPDLPFRVLVMQMVKSSVSSTYSQKRAVSQAFSGNNSAAFNFNLKGVACYTMPTVHCDQVNRAHDRLSPHID